jgi:phosphatidylserine decarboxylase
LGLPIVAGFWIFTISFFRDPERTIPTDPNVLVSPADGTIWDIGEVDEPDFPNGRALRIGIFLSLFNVHVNRLPGSGEVTSLRYFAGRFADARTAGCGATNEQFWIDLKESPSGRLMRVKQIAGACARRIVCWLKLGEQVQRGDRLGMIKFGSRTELFISAGEALELLVKVGDKVKGGSSVLLRFRTG